MAARDASGVNIKVRYTLIFQMYEEKRKCRFFRGRKMAKIMVNYEIEDGVFAIVGVAFVDSFLFAGGQVDVAHGERHVGAGVVGDSA